MWCQAFHIASRYRLSFYDSHVAAAAAAAAAAVPRRRPPCPSPAERSVAEPQGPVLLRGQAAPCRCCCWMLTRESHRSHSSSPKWPAGTMLPRPSNHPTPPLRPYPKPPLSQATPLTFSRPSPPPPRQPPPLHRGPRQLTPCRKSKTGSRQRRRSSSAGTPAHLMAQRLHRNGGNGACRQQAHDLTSCCSLPSQLQPHIITLSTVVLADIACSSPNFGRKLPKTPSLRLPKPSQVSQHLLQMGEECVQLRH